MAAGCLFLVPGLCSCYWRLVREERAAAELTGHAASARP
jgi:hypothetical protein